MAKRESKTAQTLFVLGKTIETMKETFSEEAEKFASMKVAFAMTIKCLEGYRSEMNRELEKQSIAIKEAEYGKTYITRCAELIKQLYVDAEAKRIKALGGSDALQGAVDQIKKTYDQSLFDK